VCVCKQEVACREH